MEGGLKALLRKVVVRIPGGRYVYERVYAPLRRRSRRVLLAKLAEDLESSRAEARELRETLSRFLALEEEWGQLIESAVEHVDFLLQFLKGDQTERGSRAILEEHERHLRALRLALRALLSRHEAQARLAEGLLVRPYGPQYMDRVQRLEKVIEYLVNLEGDDPPE